MTFPKGHWATEYAVEYLSTDGKSWGQDVLCTEDAADERAAWWQKYGYETKTLSRQVFHGEWQPLPERTNT